jgi:hypothetical protein
MTPELLEEMMERAAKKAVAEYTKEHPCHLTEPERSMIHSLHEAMIEEGANHGTWRVLIQWGVNLTDITKQVRRGILLIIGLLALIFGAKLIWR